MKVTEAPVNSEPVATSQANADSLMSQAQLLQLQMSLLQQPQRLQQTLLIHNLLKRWQK